MASILRRFVREEEGQDLIEYALLAALIAVACTAAMTYLAGRVSLELNNIGDQIVTGGS